MQAIRVRKRGVAGMTTVHWLFDPGRTYCGRRVADLDVVDELELEQLSSVDGCRGCVRFADGWTPRPPGRAAGELRITAEPALGRLRTTGPLVHGPRSHPSRGRRLA